LALTWYRYVERRDLSGAKSLGAGIRGCNPQADAKTEARNAKKQANQEIKESGS